MASMAPDWPALMTRATAARYCDMSPKEFEQAVASCELPPPMSEFCGKPRWSRRSLDAIVERRGGGDAPDWRAECKQYAQG